MEFFKAKNIYSFSKETFDDFNFLAKKNPQ